MPRTIDLLRSTVALVIDHHTVFHAPQTASVHVLEKDASGAVTRGQDLDGVTAAELSIAGDIAAGITGDKLVAFVGGIAGVPVTLDVLPPAPKAAAPAEQAAAAA